ncbi:MAG: hypothetical protein U5K71_08265 [Gracilimonas sp.]|nr:hypothetical protein [Gracilimonas sp.]
MAHLNFPFSKPFEPDPDYLRQVEFENEKRSRKPLPKYGFETGTMKMDENFWSDLISSEKPLIVVGPTSKSDKLDFITPLCPGFRCSHILAEPGSQIPTSRHTIQGFEGFLRSMQKIWTVLNADLILRFGQQPVSKALNNYLDKHSDIMQISFMNPNQWIDGSLSSTKQVILKAPLEISEVSGVAADKNWLEKVEETLKKISRYSGKINCIPPLLFLMAMCFQRSWKRSQKNLL